MAAPALAHHAGFRPSPDLDAAAYLDANRARLGIATPASDLEVDKILAAPQGGHIVRFAQKAKGIRVYSGSLTVRLDADGNVLRVLNRVKQVGEFDARPLLTARDASRAAARASPEGLVLRTGAAESGIARLVVIPGPRALLAYEVWLPPALRTSNPYAFVDARTGEVLAFQDRVYHDSGGTPDDAQVFAASTDVEPSTLTPVVLGDFPQERNPDGYLVGEHVLGLNCCATSGCDGSTPPPTVSGTARFGGANVPFEIAICDERPRATNTRTEGNYGYPPAPEAVEGDPVPSASEEDEFAEVNAYWHVNVVRDFVLTLDPTFVWRAESTPLHVTANFLAPELGLDSCEFSLSTGAKCTKLARVDNAMFAPAGAFEDFGVETDYQRPFDSMILFQGTKADFAYDADVIYHEFGHGVVLSSAVLSGIVLDEWGAWTAPGALNEGYADWLAAAKTNDPVIGDYVGTRIAQGQRGEGELGLRDISIAEQTCPEVIIGEVHEDSLPWSGALWDIRKALPEAGAFTQNDFDKAVLAALKGLANDSSFDDAALATLAEIEAAAPSQKASAEAAFRARGALGCPRARLLKEGEKLDLIILAAKNGDPRFKTFAPGPVQVKLRAPEGATAAEFKYTVQNPLAQVTGGLGGGGSSTKPKVWIAWSKDAPVKFSYDPVGGTTRDVGDELAPTQTRLPYAITLALEGKCGGQDLYVAFENYVDTMLAAAEVEIVYTVDAAKVEACKPPPPPPDAGTGSPDGGADDGSGGEVPARGCGCGGGAAALGPLFGLALGLLRRRRPTTLHF